MSEKSRVIKLNASSFRKLINESVPPHGVDEEFDEEEFDVEDDYFDYEDVEAENEAIQEVVSAFVDRALSDQIPGKATSWSSEVDRAAEDLESKIQALVAEIHTKLHNGDYA